MTGNPEIDGALAHMEGTVENLRSIIRRLRIWVAVSIVAAVLSLAAVGAVALDMHHSADQRAELRCAETIDRTEAIAKAISGAVDDVMDAIADQVADDPDTARALDTIRARVDRRLTARLDQIPQC